MLQDLKDGLPVWIIFGLIVLAMALFFSYETDEDYHERMSETIEECQYNGHYFSRGTSYKDYDSRECTEAREYLNDYYDMELYYE